MSYFATVLGRSGVRWDATELDLDDCESLEDILDLVRDVAGEQRLLFIEQDDEYAVLARVDDDEAQVFLSDGHAADAYPIAALVADELTEIGVDELADDELLDDAPPRHDSAPFGDAAVAEDFGTSADELLALCQHEGTLPMDLIVAVCEKAGCAEALESVRA